MSYIFTDYNKMVGKRPRQTYWKELQDATTELHNQLSNISSQSISIINPRPATELLDNYPKGVTVFEVQEGETTRSGYPQLAGTVETVYISDNRNIQHFFAATDTPENSGETYYRQWFPSVGWTSWETIITDRNIQTKQKTYIHKQLVASNEWLIKHDLDKYPSVTIVDSGDNVVLGDITYLSKKEIKITFSVSFGGRAYIN